MGVRSLLTRPLYAALTRLRRGPDGTIRFEAENFRKREVYRPNYEALCGHLTDLLTFENVLDIGSANGFVIDALTARGKDCRGVELSDAVLPFLSPVARERITFGDATKLGKVGDFDLVTCIEVAEHIPPERSAALMAVIAGNARDWVYFTAATPHQPGTGHINCRPHFYWLNEFRKRGFELDYAMTSQLLERIQDLKPCVWLPLNTLVLRRTT